MFSKCISHGYSLRRIAAEMEVPLRVLADWSVAKPGSTTSEEEMTAGEWARIKAVSMRPPSCLRPS